MQQAILNPREQGHVTLPPLTVSASGVPGAVVQGHAGKQRKGAWEPRFEGEIKHWRVLF